MRVMCPKCGKIFEATASKEVAFCSDCGTTFTLDQGKKLFDKQFGGLTKQAYLCLTQLGDYDKAIELYESCLEIKPNDLSSIIGIALATLYKQDFLNINFDKIIPIIDKYDIYLNEENTFLFCSFIEDVLKETKKYLAESQERLFKDGKCIAQVYLGNYKKSLDDILTLIAYFKDSFTLMSEEEKNIFFEDHDLSKDLDTLESQVQDLKNKNYEVLNPEILLEDNRIIVVNKKAIKTYKYATVYLIVMAALFILFLLLGAILGNNLFYYLMIIPLVLAAGGYLFYYYFFIKKRNK